MDGWLRLTRGVRVGHSRNYRALLSTLIIASFVVACQTAPPVRTPIVTYTATPAPAPTATPTPPPVSRRVEFLTKWEDTATSNLFDEPRGIAVHPSGNIYVTDHTNYNVKVFGPSGNFLFAWGRHGASLGSFQGPIAVDVDELGNIYVLDRTNGTVDKFDETGRFVQHIYNSTTQPACPHFAQGVAVNSTRGYVYIADTYDHRLCILTLSGELVKVVGSSGSADGQFLNPTSVAVGTRGEVYVADLDNRRIQVFDAVGDFVTKWILNFAPYDIAIDRFGQLYVTASRGNAVFVLDSKGQVLFSWGASGHGDGQFDVPLGIAVDAQSYVYVTDSGNRRVQKFTSSGEFVTKWGTAGKVTGFRPSALAVNAAGKLYAVGFNDLSGDPFNPHGRAELRTFRLEGERLVEQEHALILDNPPDLGQGYNNLAVNAKGDVYLFTEGGKVRQYDHSLTLVSEFQLRGQLDRGARATAATVDDEGYIYASADWPVYKYRLDGSPLDERGLAGEYQVKYPRDQSGDANGPRGAWFGSYFGGIAVDASGNVYVADNGGAPGILKFNPEGRLLDVWPVAPTQWSREAGSSAPLGWRGNSGVSLAVDSEGNVYAARRTFDYGSMREVEVADILKFSSKGQLLTAWGIPDTTDQISLVPGDLVVDRQMNIYVTDQVSGGIQVLRQVPVDETKPIQSTPRAAPTAVPHPAKEQTSVLFVNNAFSGGLTPVEGKSDTFDLTLKGVSTFFFVNERNTIIGGRVVTRLFTGNWATGKDSFATSAPEAALEIRGGPADGDVLAIQLLSAKYEEQSDRLTYRVRVLGNLSGRALALFNERKADQTKMPNAFGLVRLFVDGSDRSFSRFLAMRACAKCDFSDANLSAAYLDTAYPGTTNLSGAILTGAKLSNSIFLYGADLSGADLSGADLAGANLIGANLTRANLSNANLSGANLGWSYLSGAILTGANLRGANLIAADLRGVDLTSTDLQGATTKDCQGCP